MDAQIPCHRQLQEQPTITRTSGEQKFNLSLARHLHLPLKPTWVIIIQRTEEDKEPLQSYCKSFPTANAKYKHCT